MFEYHTFTIAWMDGWIAGTGFVCDKLFTTACAQRMHIVYNSLRSGRVSSVFQLATQQTVCSVTIHCILHRIFIKRNFSGHNSQSEHAVNAIGIVCNTETLYPINRTRNDKGTQWQHTYTRQQYDTTPLTYITHAARNYFIIIGEETQHLCRTQLWRLALVQLTIKMNSFCYWESLLRNHKPASLTQTTYDL